MLQRLVANWLRQQAGRAVLDQLQPGRLGPDEDAEVVGAQVVVFFKSRAEAGGLVDLMEDVRSTQCAGFVERSGWLGRLRLVAVEAPLPPSQLAPVVRDVLTLHQPTYALSSGFCWSLDEAVRPGMIVLASQIEDGAGYSLSPGLRVDAETLSPGVALGKLRSHPEMERQDVRAEGCLALEPQAAIIAEVSRLLQVRMLSIHMVYGRASDVPAPLLAQWRAQGSLAGRLGAAAGALLDQPGSVKSLLQDKQRALVLSDRLAKFLPAMLEQLLPAEDDAP